MRVGEWGSSRIRGLEGLSKLDSVWERELENVECDAPSVSRGRTLLRVACNVRTPLCESYLYHGNRNVSSSPKSGTLQGNLTPKRVDFLQRLVLYKLN